MHEVTGANGKIRPTTIADARKLGLVPSVTTVMDVTSKPALINWIQDQLISAAVANPFHPDEWELEAYKKFLIEESKRVGREAAAQGNYVHDLMDQYFKTGASDKVYVPLVIEKLNQEFGNVEWISEAGFAHKDGFGGRVDLHSKTHNIIVDFKTKDKPDIASIKSYDDHKIQLAAYQIGLELPVTTRRYNMFISTCKGYEGQSNLVENKEFDKPRDIFAALLQYWKVKNNYDSSTAFGGVK